VTDRCNDWVALAQHYAALREACSKRWRSNQGIHGRIVAVFVLSCQLLSYLRYANKYGYLFVIFTPSWNPASHMWSVMKAIINCLQVTSNFACRLRLNNLVGGIRQVKLQTVLRTCRLGKTRLEPGSRRKSYRVAPLARRVSTTGNSSVEEVNSCGPYRFLTSVAQPSIPSPFDPTGMLSVTFSIPLVLFMNSWLLIPPALARPSGRRSSIGVRKPAIRVASSVEKWYFSFKTSESAQCRNLWIFRNSPFRLNISCDHFPDKHNDFGNGPSSSIIWAMWSSSLPYFVPDWGSKR